MVTRVTGYKGFQIEVSADQDHDSPEWAFWYKIEPEPELLTSVPPHVADKLITRHRWATAEDALSAGFAEARAFVDVQIFRDAHHARETNEHSS